MAKVAFVAGAVALAHCGASSSDSQGFRADGSGSAGASSNGSCSSFPDCGGCLTCFEACLCQSGDAVNCSARCAPGGPPATGTGGGAATDGGGLPPPPPEAEVEASFLSPVSTGNLVWTANPESGQVAIVDAVSLEVRTVEAGFAPTHIAAVPSADDNLAIVLNVRSRDATLLRATDDAVAASSFETHEDANSWAVSPTGAWAVAWSNAEEIVQPDPTDGFQDVTVLGLEPGSESSIRLNVGFRPRRLVFDAAETRAFAVTEPGVSIIALDELGPRIVDLVEVSLDPLENPASRDVTITPDGNFALVRRDLSSAVGLVDLRTGEISPIQLSGEVTDLDLSEDGTRAIAVVRENSEVSVLPIPEAATDPSTVQTQVVDGELFGSVALPPQAGVALLFTNALPNDRLTIVKTALSPDFLTHRTVSLKSPVSAVFAAPDAEHAIAFQLAGSSSKKGAFSVVPTRAVRSPKIVGTDARPFSVAIDPAPSSDRALVTIRDDDARIFGAYLVRMPTLQVDFIPLASAPLAAGIVAEARRAFVSQLHPEGRITFVDLDDGSARTLTGFELGSKVVD